MPGLWGSCKRVLPHIATVVVDSSSLSLLVAEREGGYFR